MRRMGYLHIENLYKSQDILLFRECYALEKVHGTSAHVKWSEGCVLNFFSGGESHERFKALFDQNDLTNRLRALTHPDITIFGEAYGGKCQGMSATYGPELRFIAFDVKVGEYWLSVPDAEQVATALGLEFVPYVRLPTDLSNLDWCRDAPSILAANRGCGLDKKKEGVVLRPLVELTKNNGDRIIAKHKRDEFRERATPQKVIDPDKLKVLADADAIAAEWVTEMRLAHVIDKICPVPDIGATPKVIAAMVEDVEREAAGEIVVSKEARAAIGRRTAQLFKARIATILR